MLAYIIFLSVNDPPPSYIYTLSLHDALPILLFSLLALAFTRYGKIPLGKDGDKPEFSTFSWVAMLFAAGLGRSEEHTSELQSRGHLVCRLLLEKKKTRTNI